jgi:hypothetical protein
MRLWSVHEIALLAERDLLIKCAVALQLKRMFKTLLEVFREIHLYRDAIARQRDTLTENQVDLRGIRKLPEPLITDVTDRVPKLTRPVLQATSQPVNSNLAEP